MEYKKYRLGIELNAGNLADPVLYALEHDGKTIVVSFKSMVILGYLHNKIEEAERDIQGVKENREYKRMDMREQKWVDEEREQRKREIEFFKQQAEEKINILFGNT